MSDTIEIEKPQRPESVPAKFWDDETGAVRTDALMKSYAALEQKLSSKETRAEPPETAEGYELTLQSELLKADPEINARLHAKGFTNEQVQEVYNLAAEKLVPMILDMVNDLQADREIERIVERFGGPEAWARVSRQLLAFGRKHLDANTLATLASSYDGIITLHRMMLEKSGGNVLESEGRGKAASIDEQALAKMMKDPRYWRDRDPAYIAKVTEGFERLYN